MRLHALPVLALFLLLSCSDTTAEAAARRNAVPDSAIATSPAVAPSDKLDSEGASATSALPAHTLINESVTDTPGKAGVTINVVVPALRETELRRLLLGLYEQALQKSFKHHTQATVVGIYAYSSVQHYESGTAQWVGMLLKSPTDPGPAISINATAVAAQHSPPAERLGLPEDKRREIFTALVRAEDRAQQEVDKAYPRSSLTRDRLDQYSALHDELKNRYTAEVRSQYGLTAVDLKSISYEGLTSNWPLPEY